MESYYENVCCSHCGEQVCQVCGCCCNISCEACSCWDAMEDSGYVSCGNCSNPVQLEDGEGICTSCGFLNKE